jgi:hypothetical protein
LGRLLGKSCPFVITPVDPLVAESMRKKGLSDGRLLASDAPARPCFGFALGVARRADVDAWAASRQLNCTPESAGASLACDDVAPDALGEPGDERGALYLRFDPDGRLVAVLRMLRVPDAARAAVIAARDRAALEQKLGTAHLASGDATAAFLQSGGLRQVRVEWRFADYVARASSTNMGDYFSTTEEFQLAR